MIRILLAALAALLVGGALSVLWRENRRRFWPALAATCVVVAAVATYVTWMPAHGRGNLPAAQVRLEPLALDTAAGSYRLRARVTNLSRDRVIVRLPVRLVVEACAPTGNAPCALHGDRTQAVLVTVQPGESREFFQVFPFDSAIPPAQLRWHASAGDADARTAGEAR